MAIGIMGGTFDPVHFGHLRTAIEVQSFCNFDQIHLIPCLQSPHRQKPHASEHDRLSMLKLALKDEPNLIANDIELNRPAPSYTVETLEHLRNQVGNHVPIGLIIGLDTYLHLSSWHRWQDIIQKSHIIVAKRPDFQLPNDKKNNINTPNEHIHQPEKPINLANFGPSGQIFILNTTALAISASKIRSIINASQSPRFLLPNSVWKYIQTNQLYT